LTGASRLVEHSEMSKSVSAIALYKKSGELLLQHRTPDAPRFPGYWMFFGGEIEDGESPEQAVKRETVEEIGYELLDPRLLKTEHFWHEGTAYTAYVFVERYDGRPLTLYEGQGMGWFLPASTNDLMMTDLDRSLIRAIAEYIERFRQAD
jgi:8-oxo-dGTP diphosphatase